MPLLSHVLSAAERGQPLSSLATELNIAFITLLETLDQPDNKQRLARALQTLNLTARYHALAKAPEAINTLAQLLTYAAPIPGGPGSDRATDSSCSDEESVLGDAQTLTDPDADSLRATDRRSGRSVPGQPDDADAHDFANPRTTEEYIANLRLAAAIAEAEANLPDEPEEDFDPNFIAPPTSRTQALVNETARKAAAHILRIAVAPPPPMRRTDPDNPDNAGDPHTPESPGDIDPSPSAHRSPVRKEEAQAPASPALAPCPGSLAQRPLTITETVAASPQAPRRPVPLSPAHQLGDTARPNRSDTRSVRHHVAATISVPLITRPGCTSLPSGYRRIRSPTASRAATIAGATVAHALRTRIAEHPGEQSATLFRRPSAPAPRGHPPAHKSSVTNATPAILKHRSRPIARAASSAASDGPFHFALAPPPPRGMVTPFAAE